MSNLELTVTRNIPAAPQAVFDAWLSPDALMKFMCPGEGMTCPKAEVDPQVGGKFLVVMTAGEQELPHTGEYKTIDRHDKLAFTWVSPYTKQDSLVTLTFEPAGDGTKLTLHHEGFPNEESRSNHEGGWTAIVELLVKTAA